MRDRTGKRTKLAMGNVIDFAATAELPLLVILEAYTAIADTKSTAQG